MTTFTYTSIFYGEQKTISQSRVDHLRAYLLDAGFKNDMTVEQLTDMLVAYRAPDGARLMPNHMCPIYLYLASTGRLWP